MGADKDERKPFKQLFQIGVVVRDMDKAVERFTQLGLGPFESFTPPSDAITYFRGKRVNAAQSLRIMKTQMGNIELELLQPTNEDTPHKEYLDAKGEGIQHLGLIVDDIDAEVESLNKKGATTLFYSEMKGEGVVAYMDLNASGVVAELVKRR
jgi:methylmalonyl-CoA/ethylmalonyl-CoA epimerase